MAARMKDIAEALGLSIVTVSKVLNKNDKKISEPTRQRVLECARKLDYRTNLAAKELATGQSKMVGLIVPDLLHGFFAEIAAHMSESLAQQHYSLIISSSRDDERLEEREIKQMLGRRVDALVVASCSTDPCVLATANREVPVILLDRRVGPAGTFPLIGTDDYIAGELATQHFVDLGRRRIAFIGAATLSPSHDREQAYRKVLSRARIKVSPKFVVRLPQNEESYHVLGERVMRQMLKLKPRPNAVFCYNDPSAWGAMQAILDEGLRIPEDIAIAGCGNVFYNTLMRVPLTSVNQNAALLGVEAAKLVLRVLRERLSKPQHSSTKVLLKPTLAVRASTVNETK